MGRRRPFFLTPGDNPAYVAKILLSCVRPLDANKRADLSRLLENFGEDEERVPLPLLLEIETALGILTV